MHMFPKFYFPFEMVFRSQNIVSVPKIIMGSYMAEQRAEPYLSMAEIFGMKNNLSSDWLLLLHQIED